MPETRNIVLPEIVGLLPVEGAMILPRTQLPLNVFSEGLKKLVQDAREGQGLIGVIQPRQVGERPLYEVGTLCYIESVREDKTQKGQLNIEVRGILRFRLRQEVASNTGYRQGRADYGGFLDDLKPAVPLSGDARHHLIASFENYIHQRGIGLDPRSFEAFDSNDLLMTLPNLCHFDPAEKQAVLETENTVAQLSLMIQLLEIGAFEDRPHLTQ